MHRLLSAARTLATVAVLTPAIWAAFVLRRVRR